MKTIKVLVGRTKKNYSAVIDENINGMVIVTADTLEELKTKVKETLDFHFDSLEEDVQEWMVKKDYELQFISLAKISVALGEDLITINRIKQKDKLQPITKIWFDGEWLFGQDTNGNTYKQSILWYWRLVEATPEQRNDYYLSDDGMHWRCINEDISFESFITRNAVEPTPMQRFFLTHRELNLCRFAKILDINHTLLYDYIHGFKTPSQQQINKIRHGIQHYAQQLADIKF